MIHPFIDENGRVTRIVKNWMLMYDLYPLIFVNDAPQKKEYIATMEIVLKNL
jgi:Fic family protein